MVTYSSMDDLIESLNEMEADFPIPGLELDDGFDDCITDHLMEDEDLDDCFGTGGPTVSVFPNGGAGGCAERLVILTDKLADEADWKWPQLEEFLLDYLVNCRPPVIRIQFHGSHYSMQRLGLLKGGGQMGVTRSFDKVVDWINTTHPPILFTLDFWYGHPPKKDRLFVV